jgi:protein-histidine pros-kinase
MLRIYGESNGVGWRQGEVVGAQIVNVPMALPLRHADQAFLTFIASLAGIFLGVFLTLNLMLGWLIIRPVRRLSQAADRISTGDFSEPEFADGGRDEVSMLGASFNRMRRSLEKAMQMIHADPHQP